MNLQVLVTHPGRQHSHQLVKALHREDMLAEYWTGVPARPLTSVSALRPLVGPLEKHALLPIPDDRVRHFLLEPIVRRATAWMSPGQQVDWSHWAMEQFDRWCADRLEEADADAVVAYENGALHTFRRAKELGMTTILDAASFHHAWQDDVYDYVESSAVHERINDHKDAEIELADHILTVSSLARESYVDGGADADRVTSVPVGCDLDRFRISSDDVSSQEDAPFTFIFAGHAGHRKGIDLLLDAASRLEDEGQNVQIWVAGGEDPNVEWSRSSLVKRLGRLPQPELADRFRQADCLVLPSRHDSFGMVVVEAMATGLPVIVTENVGAKEAVTEGVSGWIILAEDADALYEQMRWCIQNHEDVRRMHKAARRDASAYSWEAYHRRVIHHLQNIVGSIRSRSSAPSNL